MWDAKHGIIRAGFDTLQLQDHRPHSHAAAKKLGASGYLVKHHVFQLIQFMHQDARKYLKPWLGARPF